MRPAPELSGAGPQGETVPWTTSVFLLLSELVMVVAKLTSLRRSEYGQDQNVRAPLHAAVTFSLSNLPGTELGQQQGIDFCF